jgi:hypothetical protein
MRRLPRKLWHRVHLTSFPLFVAATVHGFTAGADSHNILVQWAVLTAGMIVFFLTMFRVFASRARVRSVGDVGRPDNARSAANA